MKLSSLRVIHQCHARSHLKEGFSPPEGAFVFETCQRKVAVFFADGYSSPSYSEDCLKGVRAYAFLLRLVCGLESELQGETEIQGQFKTAWNRFENADHRQAELPAPLLAPWIQRILEDAKEIRAQELQNLGSQSYGSLVRKVLRESAVEKPGPQKILVIGAGQLASEILPWLFSTVSGVENEISVWNRSKERLFELKSSFNQIHALSPGAEKAAWVQSDHVVLCVPFSAGQDSERVQWWNQSTRTHRKVIHLGGARSEAGAFLRTSRFFALDDVLNLQKAQGHARREQIQRALRVCEEKAHLRSMGTGSLSLPHGWEDLAVFAS